MATALPFIADRARRAAVVADIASAPKQDGDYFATLGRLTAGAGGANSYIYRSTGKSGVTTNAGTLISLGAGDDYLEALDAKRVSIEQFGASTSGTAAANATAINAAIASGAKRIEIPSGTYSTQAITCAVDGVSIVGEGTLKLGDGEVSSLLVVTGDNCCIQGITLDGNRAAATPDRTVSVGSCSGFRIEGTRIINSGTAIRLADVSRACIHNNEIYDFTVSAIYVRSGCSDITEVGNVIDDNGNLPTSKHAIDVEANTGESTTTNVVIVGNVVSSEGTPCQLTGSLVSRVTVAGNSFHNTNGGSSSNGFKDDATSGLILSSNTITGAFYGIFSSSTAPIYKNNTLIGGSTGTGIRIASTGAKAVGNTILGFSDGVDVRANCYVMGNDIYDCARDGINGESSGSAGSKLIRNHISGVTRYGIRADHDGMIIKDNELIGGSGVYAAYIAGDDSYIANNLLFGNATNYMRFAGSTGCLVMSQEQSWINNLTLATNTLRIPTQVT